MYSFEMTIKSLPEEINCKSMHAIIFISILLLGLINPYHAEGIQKKKGKTMSAHKPEFSAEATFGNGCFWCSEAIFSRIKGVYSVKPGFSGGHTVNPSYKEVVTGTTGHAEVIRITYDPQQISYLQLLEVFFKTHDPTTLNRQGNDIGTQYRSAIFYHDEDQKNMAIKVKESLSQAGIWSDPIVTEISQLNIFYEAEAYHKNYFANNPDQAYCKFVVLPKVEKFEQLFKDILKAP